MSLMPNAQRIVDEVLASLPDVPVPPAPSPRIRQARRMRLRYLRYVDPLTIQHVTDEELWEIGPRRAGRICCSGEWRGDFHARLIRRPVQGAAA